MNGGKPINFINDPFFKSFLSHGMILVSVDVRGTGASFGAHLGPWSPEEQQVGVGLICRYIFVVGPQNFSLSRIVHGSVVVRSK